MRKILEKIWKWKRLVIILIDKSINLRLLYVNSFYKLFKENYEINYQTKPKVIGQ